MKKRHLYPSLIEFLGSLLVFCLLILSPLTSVAEDKKTATVEAEAEGEVKLKEMNKNEFEYVIEGRPDPFAPFLRPKAVSNLVDPNAIIPPSNNLSGMQLFEPGQLTLVGIMGTEETNIALVQDSTGKGYVLREGIKIGKRGVITQIEANIVRIVETAVTRSGRELKTKINMVLKKEGEE